MKPEQQFVYTRTYSRYLEDQKRRETYDETGNRYITYMCDKLDISKYFADMGRQAILNMDVMPSMRAMWAAGGAADNCNISIYNCSYTAIDCIKAFSEVLYILMSGTGVGFSIEASNVSKLPQVAKFAKEGSPIIVADSKEGWATALDTFLAEAITSGIYRPLDVSGVRPKGARLKTMGGRSSGPEPFVDLIAFCKAKLLSVAGGRLRPIDCLDILNKIADIVVVGGVRRSSQISLSDLNDREVAGAKSGQFWIDNPQRSMSNNSVAYISRPPFNEFLDEFTNLIKSGTGERGVFNRQAAKDWANYTGRRNSNYEFGTNPCGEINLRPSGLCNLSEVVARAGDSLEVLKDKVKIATMFGAWQATFTDFKYLRKEWKINAESERLLGVSVTGIMDHKVLGSCTPKANKWWNELRNVAITEAEKWSKRLGINMPAAITCVKPSGTVSQLVDSASGIHARFANYYIRRYRISTTDPLFNMLVEQGMPWSPENGQFKESCSTAVLSYPVKAPTGAITRHDLTALQQLEHWQMVKHCWTEHNPSATIYVEPDEWLKVADWVWTNFDTIGGLSFLPKTDHIYQQAPYEEVDETKYKELAAAMPKIDYSQLSKYEQEDNTEGSRSYACVGDKCELS